MATDETIQGLSALMDSLGRLPSALDQKQILAASLRAAAAPIATRMEELAPDDPLTPGSRLAEIAVSVVQQTSEHAVAKIGPEANAELRVSQAGLGIEYGSAHEAARPYARPAFDAGKAEALDILGGELASRIIKELGVSF